jgi:hypothetical protein
MTPNVGLAADRATFFSSYLFPPILDVDRAPRLKAIVGLYPHFQTRVDLDEHERIDHE